MKFMLLGTLIVLGSLTAQAQAQEITPLPSSSVDVALSPTVCIPGSPTGGFPGGPIGYPGGPIVGGCTTVCYTDPVHPPTPIFGNCPSFFKNSRQGMTITVNGVPYAGVAGVIPTGRSVLGYSCSDAIVSTLAKNSAGNTALYSELWECTEWATGNQVQANWTPEAGMLVLFPGTPIYPPVPIYPPDPIYPPSPLTN